ncbi:MAG: SRPBCC family protein [Nanoarchaeota archaeon]|nr:SRPBCC family protein [Nanoarchaeota archaeon]
MKILKQEIVLNASCHEVYEAFMDSERHSMFTHDKAEIDRVVGGKIKAYGDYIIGENLELVPDKLIVQKWRANDWPKEHFSIVRFELKEIFGLRGKPKAKIIFTQENIPESFYEEIKQGWQDYYWNSLKTSFGW